MSFKIIFREKGKAEIYLEGAFDYKSREDAEKDTQALYHYKQWYDISIESRP